MRHVAVKVRAGETYRLEAWIRSGREDAVSRFRDRIGALMQRVGLHGLSGWWDAGTDSRLLRRHVQVVATCPLCLMRSWILWGGWCDFCGATGETLECARVSP